MFCDLMAIHQVSALVDQDLGMRRARGVTKTVIGDLALKTSKMLKASIAAALLCASAAQATIIDFDAATVTSELSFSNFYLGYAGKNYTEEGYTFSSTGLFGNRVVAPSITYNNNSYSLGETLFGTTTLTSASGLFNISSLDLLRLPNIVNTTVTFTGIKGDASVVTQNFTFTGNGWGTLNFDPSFTSLASLKWSQGLTVYVVDNLNVSAVPEPETYAMMMAGLGLVGLAARRRKQA